MAGTNPNAINLFYPIKLIKLIKQLIITKKN